MNKSNKENLKIKNQEENQILRSSLNKEDELFILLIMH